MSDLFATAVPVTLTTLRRASARLWPFVARLGSALWAIVETAWSRASGRQRATATGLLALALLGFALWGWRDAPGHWFDTWRGNRPLMRAASWHYNLDQVDVEKLAKSPADVLVIDYARLEGKIPLTREEVARLKIRADGRPRTVISYMSIGEAETYRWYWRADYQGDDLPGWEVAENCAWPRAHMVRFWHDGWRDIIYRGRRSYLKRIIDAGFDGVYLDRVDIYTQQTAERPTARADMMQFVAELADTGRRLKPGFLIIPQNAEDLLADRAYRNKIDGLGKEDLLAGEHGTGLRNKSADIARSTALLRLLLADYKPVFAVEYPATREQIAASEKELRALGMVPTFAHRSLDGDDPLAPRANSEKQYGTPEWIAANCKDKPHW